ncbi:site-specific integrase [Nocardia uniformis]|uniref:Site-specific integrase n=1 Tax=Nocardia uniformis TaxID=53432 RepID=A0A849CBB1_9NOCA|nr:site-specific integrase [Nocardia uniformis]NNH75914.1 site-specific integrase [Nocardia uniformis]
MPHLGSPGSTTVTTNDDWERSGLTDLRHTYASRLVRAKVPLDQVQILLGHASVRTTQRYAKLGESQWTDVRHVLG